MGNFDPEAFVGETVSAELDTELPLVPEGDYPAQIADRRMPNDARQRDDGQQYAIMRLTWEIQDPAVTEATGVQAPRVPQTVFLDLTPEGKIDTSKGRNLALGRLRKALGQNTKKNWSFDLLDGQAAIVRVAHRTFEDRETGENRTVHEVVRVAPLK